MIQIKLSWADLKSEVSNRGTKIQYFNKDNSYVVFTYDNPVFFYTNIIKDGGSDQSDFELNYQTVANQGISQIDTDGAQIVRAKAAKKGWTYGAIPFEIKTSTLASVPDTPIFSQTYDGNDRPGFTYKIFDNNGNEITDPGILSSNLNNAVKTQVDFEPTYDYEVIGGALRIESDLSQDVRLWIIAVPDIAEASGGSKEMAGGINLRVLAPQNSLEIDGRVSKSLSYSATYHTNKIRFIFKHPAGLQTVIYITIEMYRL